MNFVARERSLHALVRGVTFLLLLLDEKTCQRDAGLWVVWGTWVGHSLLLFFSIIQAIPLWVFCV